VSDELTPKN